MSGYCAYTGSLLQIRDVPEEARRGLKARAAARGQSLNAYLLDPIEREPPAPPSPKYWTGPRDVQSGRMPQPWE